MRLLVTDAAAQPSRQATALLIMTLGKMKIQSLQSIEGVVFGADRSALGPFGPTIKETQNRRKEDEFHYEDIIFRFDETGFVEASFRTPEELTINGEVVSFLGLLEFIKKKDPEYFEYVGFAICPQLGLAYDLEHDGTWATAFKQGRWDKFKK